MQACAESPRVKNLTTTTRHKCLPEETTQKVSLPLLTSFFLHIHRYCLLFLRHLWPLCARNDDANLLQLNVQYLTV